MENTTDREMRATRTFKAPLKLVWEVWTDPKHIMNWWGPNGFTNTLEIMDFREGGEWKFTMHGPDGRNYANLSVFKEIVPFQKIVFEHFNPHFITTVLFEERDSKTSVDWTLVFDTAETREIVIKSHNADKAHHENLDKLEAYLSERSTR